VERVPLGLALDTSHLYFTDSQAGRVARVSKLGGDVEVLVSGQTRPVAIAVDESSVYWVNGMDATLLKTAK